MAKRLEKIYNRLVGKDDRVESSEEGEVTAGEAGREGDGEVVVEDGGIINLDSDSSEEIATRRQGRTGQEKRRRLHSSESEEDGGNVRGPTLLERGAMEEIRGSVWGRVVRHGRHGNEVLYGTGGKIKLGELWDKARGQPTVSGRGRTGQVKPGKKEREARRETERQKERDQVRLEKARKRKAAGTGLGASRQVVASVATARICGDTDRIIPVEAFPTWGPNFRRRTMAQEEFLRVEWEQRARAAQFTAMCTRAEEAEQWTILYTHLLGWCAVPRTELRRHYDENWERRVERREKREGRRRTACEKSRRRKVRGREPGEEPEAPLGIEGGLLPPLNRGVRKGMSERALLTRSRREETALQIVRMGRALVSSVRELESVALQQFTQVWLKGGAGEAGQQGNKRVEISVEGKGPPSLEWRSRMKTLASFEAVRTLDVHQGGELIWLMDIPQRRRG